MKAISLSAFIWVLTQIPASAQWHNAASPAPIVVSTPIPSMSGILRTIVLRDSIDLEIAPTVHRTFHLAKVLVVVGPNGRVVEPSTVQPGGPVIVHFMHDGNDIMVDRIFLQ